jgi:hypothetical protein
MQKEFKSVEINNVSDIKNALIPFIQNLKKNDIVLNGEIEWIDKETDKEIGKKMKTSFSANNKELGLRDLLVEGFDQVKEQNKVWNELHDALEDDEYSVTLPRVNINDFHMPVDRLIKIRLGGKRDGLTVVWVINGKKYAFDPYTCEFKEDQ